MSNIIERGEVKMSVYRRLSWIERILGRFLTRDKSIIREIRARRPGWIDRVLSKR